MTDSCPVGLLTFLCQRQQLAQGHAGPVTLLTGSCHETVGESNTISMWTSSLHLTPEGDDAPANVFQPHLPVKK
jgi:hypothetical protein